MSISDEVPTRPELRWDTESGRMVSNVPIKWYAFIIDGQVVFTQYVDQKLEYLTAVFSSKPTIAEIPEAYAGIVKEGWEYDESRGIHAFQPPVSNG